MKNLLTNLNSFKEKLGKEIVEKNFWALKNFIDEVAIQKSYDKWWDDTETE